MALVSIPRIFHRIWLDEPIPPRFEAFWTQLKALHPGWEFKSWERTADVREHLMRPDLFDSFTDYPAAYALRADLARYDLIAKFGGVYVDTDIEPLRSFEPLLDDDRAFIAWENDHRLCPSVFGATPQHPAVRQLVEALPERLALTGDPSHRTGPAFVTEQWRERDDVRRLPPSAFYPVGWWEQHLLGGPYPERSYAVHHWAKGWGDDAAPKAFSAGRTTVPTSILVAFRDPDGSRTPAWDLIRAKLTAEVDAEIVVATDDGTDPFHKTRALNRAAAQASGDVFLIWDADTWVDAALIAQAVDYVSEAPRRWCRPWNVKVKANEAATRHILELGAAWDGTLNHRGFGTPENTNTFQHAPPLVLTRQAFEAVDGFDERFRGWGQEDVAFSLSLRRIVGHQRALRGHAIHLWHPRIGRSGKDLWPGQESDAANLELIAAYKAARTAQAMQRLIDDRRAVAV